MKKKLISLLLLAFLSGGPVASNELESWYTYWGGGWSNVTYPEELENAFDLLDALPGTSNFALNLDLLGFYWPRSEHQLVGFVANAFGDRYEWEDEWMQFNGFTYAISTMHFWQSRIGQGPFVRLDVGPSLYNFQASDRSDVTGDWGLGFIGGVGYGLPVTSGTRLLFQVNYGLRRADGENIGALNLTLGGMW